MCICTYIYIYIYIEVRPPPGFAAEAPAVSEAKERRVFSLPSGTRDPVA